MKVAIEELNEAQMNWAVAVALGKEPQWFTKNSHAHTVRIANQSYSPSTSWCDAGPIIAKERISLLATEDQWEGRISAGVGYFHATGPTVFIAAMRTFLTAHVCDPANEVDVPTGEECIL